MITRASLLFFFLTLLLITLIDFFLKDLDLQWVLKDLFDFRENPGNSFFFLIIFLTYSYSIAADMRIRKKRNSASEAEKNK